LAHPTLTLRQSADLQSTESKNDLSLQTKMTPLVPVEGFKDNKDGSDDTNVNV